ncbi:MAG: DUF2889 domain-containing protein [Actinomycetota bacterium]
MSISIHQRSYDCEAFAEDDGRIRVRGRLVDNKPQGLGLADGEPLIIHEMVVQLYVTVPAFEIDAVDVDMVVHPYAVCTDVLPDYQQLVGLSITRGYSRRVKELFGGPNGCSHVGALLQAMGPVAIQSSWSLVNLHDDPADRLVNDTNEPERMRRLKLNTNTCHVWREDGDHMAAVARGDMTLRPGWEVERLRALGVDV